MGAQPHSDQQGSSRSGPTAGGESGRDARSQAPFRVCTVDDFGVRQQQQDVSRRRAGQTTTACAMCRSRKVRCVEANVSVSQVAAAEPDERSRCLPCRQAGLDCQWNTVDRRKRRKVQHTTGEKAIDVSNSPGLGRARRVQRESHPPLHEEEPRLDAINSHIELGSDGRSKNIGPGAISQQPGAVTAAAAAAATPSRNLNNAGILPPGMDLAFDSGVGDTQGASSHPFLAGIYQYPDETVPWTDLQDFVFGFDFMQDGENFVTQAAAFSPTAAAQDGIVGGGGPASPTTAAAAAAKSRLIRLRYYRRFGPTAVMPGLRRLALVVDSTEEDDGHHAHGNVCAVHDTAQDAAATAAAGIPQDHVHQRSDDISPTAPQAAGFAPSPLVTPTPSSSSSSVASLESKLFDRTSRKPHPDIVCQVLDVFFDNFGGHFPFLHPQILGGHVRSQEASSFLLNAIAALTVRFCSLDGPLAALQDKYDVPWQRGAPFLVKAKEQLVPLLSIPAPEVVAGLLILAWAEFGDRNEAGLWMFAGMAIRMAQDLGFHRIPETDVDPDINFHDHARPSPDGTYILTDAQSMIHQQKARLVMFWSVFILDVCVSLVTGRPPTIRRDEIEVPIPSYNDMKLAQLDFDLQVTAKNVIFPASVGFMLHFSEAVELLNRMPSSRGPSGVWSTTTTDDDRQKSLTQIREVLLQQYSALPPEMVFSIDNFKASVPSAQSGVFLVLHLFFYTFMALLSNTHSRDARQGLHHAQRSRRPSASGAFIGAALPVAGANNAAQREAAGGDSDSDREPAPRPSVTSVVACQKVVQILSVAELVDKTSYLASPFTNHCLFVAAAAVLGGEASGSPRKPAARSGHDDGAGLLGMAAGTDLEFLYRRLKDQASYFGGVRSVVAVVEQKRRSSMKSGEWDGIRGGAENRGQPGAEGDEADEPEDDMHRITGLGDAGIVNRYSIPRRPGMDQV